MENQHKLKLRDIPLMILSDSLLPLSAKEIWAEAVKRGLDKAVASKGKTPWDSIGAFLYTQAKIKGSGIVAESAKPVLFRAVAKTTSDIKHMAKHQGPNAIKPADAEDGDVATNSTLNAIAFEGLIARLLDEMDFQDTQVTKASGDGGIDVRGTWKVADGILIKMAIQAKRWKKGRNVQSPVVDAVRGALAASERGMIITTSDFSKGARENANDPTKSSTISLVNGEQLVKLLVQCGIGVTRKSAEILELDEDFENYEEGK